MCCEAHLLEEEGRGADHLASDLLLFCFELAGSLQVCGLSSIDFHDRQYFSRHTKDSIDLSSLDYRM